MSDTVRRHHALVPAVDSMLLLTDTPEDHPDGLHAALVAANATIAAAGAGFVVVQCVQPLIDVALAVEVWPHEPERRPEADREWNGPVPLELRLNRAVLALAETPDRLGQVELPAGPGEYRADFWHAGRAETLARQPELAHQLTRLGVQEWLELTAPLAGAEAYLLRLWPA